MAHAEFPKGYEHKGGSLGRVGVPDETSVGLSAASPQPSASGLSASIPHALKFRAYDAEDSCYIYFTLADIYGNGGVKTPHGWTRVDFIAEDVRVFTGMVDCDGAEIYDGDEVVFVSGPYSRHPYTDLKVHVRWNPKGMWSLHWSDEGLNNYWIASPEKLRVVK